MMQCKAYVYAKEAVKQKSRVPKYVKKQCKLWLEIADGKNQEYMVSEKRISLIEGLTGLMVMPKGLQRGKLVRDCLVGFQWLFIIAVLCTMYRDNPTRRKYETAILEIARKNGKTFLVAVLFILLMLLEPNFSRLYSVAPDGALSREVQTAIREIIACSPALQEKFKIRRDDILCKINQNQFFPLNYSNSRLDGKLPNVFLADEVGALPNNYAVEAMRSGQLTILNKLGCIISTKYPTVNNPFEDEVQVGMRALDVGGEESIFCLLFEPDDKKKWMSNDRILEQANPLALELPVMMEDLKRKRAAAIASPKKRENFLTKHCNIIYSGMGTETYVAVDAVKACECEKIDWEGRDVWLGVDLSISTDNCAVAMVAEEDGDVYGHVMVFYPAEREEEKMMEEKVDYRRMRREGLCIACGEQTVDYGRIEEYVLGLEERYGVHVLGIGYDRYNALSSAQKWEREGYETTIIRQHSDTLHPPTKLLKELILGRRFHCEKNELLEENFQNARCNEDTNKNMYVNKKKSRGKVDMVVALINATFLMQQEVIFGEEENWGAQVL